MKGDTGMKELLNTYNPEAMKNDWLKEPGLELKYKGIAKKVQAVLNEMFDHAYALWKKNMDILFENNWIAFEDYLKVGCRYRIKERNFDAVANYVFDEFRGNNVNEKMFIYTQNSKYRYVAGRKQNTKYFGGFDCSSFLVYLLEISGYWKPMSNPTTTEWPKVMEKLGFKKVQSGVTASTVKYSQLRSGDIVCTDSKGHIQIVFVPGTNTDNTYMLESKTIPGMRYNWDTHKNSNAGYTGMCGPSITVATGEFNTSKSSVWRLTTDALKKLKEQEEVKVETKIEVGSKVIFKRPIQWNGKAVPQKYSKLVYTVTSIREDGRTVLEKGGTVMYATKLENLELANKVEEDETVETPVVKEDNNTFKVVVDCYEVNLREGPGTACRIIRTIKHNQEVECVEEKDGWYKLANGAGYITANPQYTHRIM